MTHDPTRLLPTSSTSPLALSGDGIPREWVEDLFRRLHAIVGSSIFTVVYAGADVDVVKAEWAEALVGYSADEVRRGLATLRARKFAPALSEFLLLCRPSLDPEVAWHEAEEGLKAHGAGQRFAWSHPAVFWAAKDFAYELRTRSFADTRKRWERRLGDWFAAGTWCEIPDPTARRIANEPAQQALTPSVAQENLARMNRVRDQLAGRLTEEPAEPAVHITDRDATPDEERAAADRRAAERRRVEAYAAERGIPL